MATTVHPTTTAVNDGYYGTGNKRPGLLRHDSQVSLLAVFGGRLAH
jgi:hypothetical protein